MTYNEYQQGALATDLYPAAYAPMLHTLGLCDEAAEVVEKLYHYDILSQSKDLPEDVVAYVRDVMAELGDVMWYVACLSNDLEHRLESDLTLGGKDNTFLTNEALIRAIRDFEADIPEGRRVIVHVSHLTVHTGYIAGRIKKAYRDHDGNIDYDLRMVIAERLRSVTFHIAAIAYNFGFMLDTILQHNHDKLASRAQRGTLHGDGDNR